MAIQTLPEVKISADRAGCNYQNPVAKQSAQTQKIYKQIRLR